MNFFDLIDMRQWKLLTDDEKRDCFRQVLMYYVNPLLAIENIQLKTFTLGGMKCRTFEVDINGETFVFVPGQKDTILGWDSGSEGLKSHDLLGDVKPEEASQSRFVTDLTQGDLEYLSQFEDQENLDGFDLSTIEGVNGYINRFTTPLRRADLPACLISKRAVPAGVSYQGTLDVVSGNFKGDEAFYRLHKERLDHILLGDSDQADLFYVNIPENYLAENQFYFQSIPGTDRYRLFDHHVVSYTGLLDEIQQIGFEFPDPDIWEFAVGGGTRRLFRWGSDVCLDPDYTYQNAYYLSKCETMFGLIVDNLSGMYELTSRVDQVKLAPRVFSSYPVEKILPFATYYQGDFVIQPEDVLVSTNFMYRKTIIMEL